MVSVILGHSYHVYVCSTVNVAAQVILCHINEVNCEWLLRFAADWSGSHLGTAGSTAQTLAANDIASTG